MQRINTSFNNINVSFSIDKRDLIINRKEKDISKYSEDIQTVIRHIRKIIIDSKNDDLYLLNKCIKNIHDKCSKFSHSSHIFHQLDNINEYEPNLLLSSQIVSEISVIIANNLYNIMKNDFYSTLSKLFFALNLVEEPYDNDGIMNKKDSNDIEQLNKYTITSPNGSNNHNHKSKIIIEELQLLQSYFINKKQIIIEVPIEINEIIIYQYVYIILNQEWLVPNCLEIRLDISKCTSQTNNRGKAYIILLLVCLMYLINKNNLNTIGNLSFNIPYAYTTELNQYLSKEKVQLTSSLHILEFLNVKLTNLRNLSIDFNGIDSLTFQTIISIISNNTQLRTLSLKLFPSDSLSSSYFSIQQLKTFCLMQNITIENGKNMYIDNYYYNEPEYYLGKLIKTFQINLDLLIYSLSLNPYYLTELKLNFKLPSIILLSEKYIEAFLKFFFKFMLYIESSMNKITNLEVNAPNFPFDADKFLNIEDEIENYKMKNNQMVTDLVLDFRMLHLNNLHMMIPSKVSNLVLGEIDNETLMSFSNHVYLFEELVCLTFTFGDYSQHNIEDNLNTINAFIKSEKPFKLESITIGFKAYFTSDMIRQILQLINDDYIQDYLFTFYKSNIKYDGLFNQFESEIKDLTQEIYYKIRQREIYSIASALQALYNNKNKKMTNVNNNSNSNLPVSIKYIIKNIYQFIQIRKKKNILIAFI